MRDTLITHIDSLKDTSCNVTTQLPDGRWVPARPLGYSSMIYKLRATWLVFTGKADALIWEGQ